MVPAFIAYGLLSAASGAVAGPTWGRRATSLLLAIAGLGTPFLIGAEHTALRALLALGGVLMFIRAVDLARDPTETPLALRVALMFALLDLRRIAPIAPTAEVRRLGYAGALGALAAGGFWLALTTRTEGAGWAVRWLAGAVAVYAMAETANQLTLFGWHLAGYRIPTQHRAPILASSVSEFWSRRWNLNVRDWLFRHCHRPLAAAGRPVLGVIAAFCASALLHFWFIAVALGAGWGLVMASFFLVQGLCVLVESGLRFRASNARRIWTIAVILGTSPLFVEPFLRLFG